MNEIEHPDPGEAAVLPSDRACDRPPDTPDAAAATRPATPARATPPGAAPEAPPAGDPYQRFPRVWPD